MPTKPTLDDMFVKCLPITRKHRPGYAYRYDKSEGEFRRPREGGGCGWEHVSMILLEWQNGDVHLAQVDYTKALRPGDTAGLRNGLRARILCVDSMHLRSKPIIGLAQCGPQDEYLIHWDKSGAFLVGANSEEDPFDIVDWPGKE